MENHLKQGDTVVLNELGKNVRIPQVHDWLGSVIEVIGQWIRVRWYTQDGDRIRCSDCARSVNPTWTEHTSYLQKIK